VSVIMPARGVGERIGPVLDRLLASSALVREVLVVVDSPGDPTRPAVALYPAGRPGLRAAVCCLVNEYGPGPANAIRFGLDAARYPVAVVAMADGSDDPRQVDDLAGLVAGGAVVAAASRSSPGGAQHGGPVVKGLLSRAAGRSLHRLAGLGTRDATNSFKAYSTRFARAAGIQSRHGFEVGIELTAKARRLRLPVAEVPTTWTGRPGQASHFRLAAWLPHYLRWYLFAFGRPLTPAQVRAGRRRLPGVSQVAAAALWVLAGLVLFTLYLHVSWTAAADSDGASNALQAWDMLHGNVLLAGWQLSDVSFYTTELPQYLLIELARGLRADVMHVAAAATYTLVVLLAAVLAKGRRTGRAGLAGAVIAAGIMLAPQPGSGVYVLLLDPDHVGTALPVLLAWLVIDRCRPRWYVPPAVGLLLAIALVADRVVFFTAAAPLAAACLARAYIATLRLRLPVRLSWYSLSLAAAAAGAAAAAAVADAVISASGGFTVAPLPVPLAAFGQLPQHLLLTVHGLLLLFGADFFSHSLGLVSVLAMLHLTGLVLAGWAVRTGLRCLLRTGELARRGGLVTVILTAAVLISLAAYLFGQKAVDLRATREFAAVLPFSAVLAGRLLPERLDRARMMPALALVLAGYLAALGRVASMPPVPAQNQQLAAFLAGRGLSYGLAGYWQASSTTLASAGKVSVRPVTAGGGAVSRGHWEARASWYDPARHDATFVVLYPPAPGQRPYPWITDVRATFGPPAQAYRTGGYLVLVWHKNLLADLR
jgi:hypothetical protein